MQFQSLAALISAAALFQAVAATVGKPSIELCGEEPRVLKTSTVPHNGGEVVLTTYACPGISKGDTPSTGIQAVKAPSKRQTQECGYACSLYCEEWTGLPTPTQFDCLELANYLINTPGEFTVPAQTVETASYDSCYSYWINYSAATSYEYCEVDWGYYIRTLAQDCIPTYNGGACINPANGAQWEIEVYSAAT